MRGAPLLVGGRGAESAKVRGVRVDRGHMCDPAARGTPRSTRGVSVAGRLQFAERTEKSGHCGAFKCTALLNSFKPGPAADFTPVAVS